MSNLDSTHKLTEFPPLEAEEKSDGMKFSFSKFMFWKKSDGSRPEPEPTAVGGNISSGQSSGNASIVSNYETTVTSAEQKKSSLEPENPSGVTSQTQQQPPRKSPLPAYYRSDSNLSNPSPDPMDGSVSPFFEARTLPNVLRRISSLIAMGTNNQSDIKKYWMPDSVSKECYECAEKFTTFRRKHHCRICGQIFCSRCCNQEIPGKIIGYSGDLRVCTYCCRIVLSYLQSADLSTDLTDDLRVVQEDLQNRFGGPPGETLSSHGSTSNYTSLSSEHSINYRSLPRRKASLGYQEERFAYSRSNKQENAFDAISTGGAPEDKSKSFGDWVNLKALWDEMCHPVNGIDWATHRHNMMKNFHHCVVGSELVDWLLAQRKVTWRGQGIQVGQMLVDANLIECVSQAEQIFLDAYALYRPIQLPLPVLQESPQTNSARSSADYGDTIEWSAGVQDPPWVKQIKNPNVDNSKIEESKENSTSSTSGNYGFEEKIKTRLPSSASLYSLDLNVCDSTVSISKPKESTLDALDPYTNNHPGASPNSSMKTTPRNPRKSTTMSITTETMTDEFLQKTLLSQKERSKEFSTPMGWHSPQQLTTDGELIAFQRLCNAYIRHENDFLMQLLESMNLSPSWADIILPIVHKVTEIVRPDVRHADDDMDIRQYIQFKKVPGGSKEKCRIVNGVVCTKNIAHRNMRSKFKDPKILLIGSSIDYQRFENRFLSLEPLVMQEYDYLKNTVARIASLTPDLVLVEKTVSRLAQEFMLDQGITLVINVKPSVMERVARSSQAVIISSADTHIGRPQLGLCHNFYLETFRISEGVQKTLMFFDGCAMHLGCTILLRGGHNAELMKVKKIMSLMMFVAYNWRLERSFHIDLFAMPPEQVTEKTGINIDSPESDEFVLAREELTSPESETGASKKQIEEKLSPADHRTSVKSEICDDFSDPLQSYLVLGSPAVQNLSEGDDKLIVECIHDSSKYSLKKCLDEVILSASPFIKYSLPYLETEAGKSCELRNFFPEEIYWSSLLYRANSAGSLSASTQHGSDMENSSNNGGLSHNVVIDIPKIDWKPVHPLVSAKLTSSSSEEVQAMVADFRRKGNRLDFMSHSKSTLTPAKRMRSNNSSWNTLENERIRSLDTHGRVDSLDPFKHQKLAVLFCSYSLLSNNAPYFCVNPWVVYMDMYGRNDISLGMFLERYCFRKSYVCPARQCDTSMLHHIRRFAHEDGCIQVLLKELESPILVAGENILMWNWCSQCKTVSPIVPISVDAWSLSFAKYLELRFHGQIYTRRGFDNQCSHSLHYDHLQYFAQHNIIASFKYSKVKLWEIYLPPNIIHIKSEPKPVTQLIDDIKVMAITGHGVYNNIMEILMSLKDSSSGLRAEEGSNNLFENLKSEKNNFRQKIEEIQCNLTSINIDERDESKDFHWKVTDSLGFLKSNVSETIQKWNNQLNDFLALRKKEEKQAKGGTFRMETEQYEPVSQRASLPRMESDPLMLPSQALALTTTLLLSTKDLEESHKAGKTGLLGLENSIEVKSRDSVSIGSTSTAETSSSSVLDEHIPTKSNEDTASINKGNFVTPPSPNQSIRSGAEHHERSKSDGDKITKSGFESEEVAESVRQDKKQSSAMKTLLSHFLTGSGSGQLIQSPWPATEHNLPAPLGSIPVTVYENEPSSVVAFTLGSYEYKSKLNKLIEKNMSCKTTDDEDTTLMKKAKYGNDSVCEELQISSSSGNNVKAFENLEDKAIQDVDGDEKDRNGKTDGHVEVQFNSNSAKFYCRVYFAENFRQLRKMCVADGEEFYIRSISRCVSWAASGGKSGSTFCKTFDDRIVVKQMSKFEIQSFLDFAPNYFDYMRTSYQEKKPTVLAKILGVYRIGFKNSQTNSASKMDILIMENLFYERNISQKFDLKGSIRNRLANTSGKEQEDLVLLDENLVNMACENPLYIRPHTKTVLTMALNNDSRFLSSQMVMDYSLLVGLDESKQELVVGIIDYIRTFTWDKRIETFVKSSGILGGQGKTPTVVSPEEYQARFCEAMDRYFLLVPDRWMGLGLGVDS